MQKEISGPKRSRKYTEHLLLENSVCVHYTPVKISFRKVCGSFGRKRDIDQYIAQSVVRYTLQLMPRPPSTAPCLCLVVSVAVLSLPCLCWAEKEGCRSCVLPEKEMPKGGWICFNSLESEAIAKALFTPASGDTNTAIFRLLNRRCLESERLRKPTLALGCMITLQRLVEVLLKNQESSIRMA